MDIVEFAEKVKELVPDRFDVIMAFEEARMFGYRIVKFHTSKDQEVALVTSLRSLDSNDVEVLGLEITILKDKISNFNSELWGLVRNRVLKHMVVGESFYAENDKIFKLVIRAKSLNRALKKLYSIVRELRKLQIEVYNRFIGYEFGDEMLR